MLQVARPGEDGPSLGEERLGDHGHPRPAVVEEVEIVLGTHHGVGRNGHGPDLDGTPERGEKGRRVEEEAEHPVLLLDPEPAQGVAGPIDQLLKPREGELTLLVEKGDLAAAPLGDVAIHEERGGVEAVGYLDGRHRHVGASVGRRV